MLNRSTIEISVNLAESLLPTVKAISTKPSTMVNELCAPLYTADGLTNLTMSSVEMIKGNLKVISEGTIDKNGYEPSDHDIVMDNYIADLTTLTVNYLGFARSVVNTEVTVLTDKICKLVDSFKYKEPENFFNVTYFKLHGIFTSALVKDEVMGVIPAGIVDFEPINLNSVLNTIDEQGNPKSVDDEYFLTGDEGTDKLILNWLEGIRFNITNWLKGQYEVNSNNFISNLDYYLLNYLFYRKLAETTNITTGDSVTKLKSKSLRNKDYFSECLNSTIVLYNNQVNLGNIVYGSGSINFSYLSTNTYSVIILEDNFEKAVAEGATIETIFGYLASTTMPELRLNSIKDNLNTYNTNWARVRKLYLAYLNSNRLETFKFVVKQAFDEATISGSLTESEKEIIGTSANYEFETKELSDKYISSLTENDIDKVHSVALELTANIRFRFSNAYTILKEMDNLLTEDESLQPQEAALNSVISYLVNYCYEQIKTVK